ncbi:ATPase, T2SS/T4P/T4SS family [Sulfitobacter sp. R18_1]|uniref:ATPase, T2SS/T4P/T4SS family n=1 Tax=Sulfitobacter sp. R18_1 TaxID=2821104 RepID=UPI001ADC9813|nr:ATPase, T2SS/T4P/T4SS family [Sulfitobacter sp. R18_1]MBO9428393.1 Flp pilus assembly complex ATPase component TadA [Sulfitobacter sp. R18_1]
MKSLSNIGFMDLYIHVKGGSTEIKPTRMRPFTKGKDLPPIVTVPQKYDEWVGHLRKAILERNGGDFSLEYDGVRYRVSCYNTSNRETWASLRKIPTDVPHMSALNIPGYVQKKLKFFAKDSGLILINGATGQGKTTTATALIGHYLEHWGDVCVTIEDPVEYDLQSQTWGQSGTCYQFEVTEDEEWAEYLKMALRWHPRYIYLGELRTPEATAQALRAATSGHLVITTIHAGTNQDAIHALRQLADPICGDRKDALIAESFLAAINQKLSPHGVDMSLLYAEVNGRTDPVRTLLRDGKIEQLSTALERQNLPAMTRRYG